MLGSTGGGEIGGAVGIKGLNNGGVNCVSGLPTSPKRWYSSGASMDAVGLHGMPINPLCKILIPEI